jgi:hypothetical protein
LLEDAFTYALERNGAERVFREPPVSSLLAAPGRHFCAEKGRWVVRWEKRKGSTAAYTLIQRGPARQGKSHRKNDENSLSYFETLFLGHKIKNKGGVQQRLDKHLLDRHVCRSTSCVRPQWPLCKAVVLVDSPQWFLYSDNSRSTALPSRAILPQFHFIRVGHQ